MGGGQEQPQGGVEPVRLVNGHDDDTLETEIEETIFIAKSLFLSGP